MKFSSFVTPALTIALVSTAGSAWSQYSQQPNPARQPDAQQQGYPQQQNGYPYTPQQGYPQQPGYPQRQDGDRNRDRDGNRNDDRGRAWDAPPDDLRSDMQRQGFRDGLQGARMDAENHRNFNPSNRDEYRHPSDNIPRRARADYKSGFAKGYNVAVQHMSQPVRDRDGDRRDDHGNDHRDQYTPR